MLCHQEQITPQCNIFQGYRVEYVAAADALTYAPESFHEFFNQRRRWGPSTMANILDLIMDAQHVIRTNRLVIARQLWWHNIDLCFVEYLKNWLSQYNYKVYNLRCTNYILTVLLFNVNGNRVVTPSISHIMTRRWPFVPTDSGDNSRTNVNVNRIFNSRCEDFTIVWQSHKGTLS